MVLLQRASMVRLRTCTATTNAVTLHWATSRNKTTSTSTATLHWVTSRNKTTSTLIMVCCLSMMDTLRCLLPVRVLQFYNCHQNEINSHTHASVCANHTTQSLIVFFLFWNVSRAVGVVDVQLSLSCCVRCLCCCEKDKRRLGRVRTKKNNGRSARFGRSLRCRFSCVGLYRFSMLTVGDRQSRDWRRGDCVRPSRSVVVGARACEAMAVCLFFVFVFLPGSRSVPRARVVARC